MKSFEDYLNEAWQGTSPGIGQGVVHAVRAMNHEDMAKKNPVDSRPFHKHMRDAHQEHGYAAKAAGRHEDVAKHDELYKHHDSEYHRLSREGGWS